MKKFYALLALVCLCANAYGQRVISGNVKGSDDNQPVPFATVVTSNRNIGVTTDVFGNYSLVVPIGTDSLYFSSIGYETLALPVTAQQVVNVVLNVGSTMGNEIVVTALALKRERKNLGYAIQSLDAREISEVKSVNILDNLAGKIAGVNVIAGPTGVGSTSKITIRGEHSFTNNNPLFVVDGVPINNNSPINFSTEIAGGFQEVDFGNGVMDLSADDIESVVVLKGPASAALYGTRASNGVILLTTKSGGRRRGIGIDFSSSTFIDKPFTLPKFQNRYGQGNSGKFKFEDGLGGGVNDNISYSWGPEMNQGVFTEQFDSPSILPDGTEVRGGDVTVRNGADITPTEMKSFPDNLKNFYRTGLTSINNIAVSAGGDLGNFRLSYTDLRSKSYIPGVNFNRNNLSGNFLFTPINKLEIFTSAHYVHSSSDNRPANGYGSENTNYTLVAWGARSLDYEKMKDYWQPGLEGLNQYSFNYTFFDNPYFTLYENRNSFDKNRLFGNIRATYRFDEHWSLSLRTGIDYSNELRQLRRAFSSNRFLTGGYCEQTVTYRESNTDGLLNYVNRFGNIDFGVSAGANRMDQNASFSQIQTLKLSQPGVYSLTNAAVPLEAYQIRPNKRINSVYGLLKLGFYDMFYLDITGRNDWSSALATPSSADNTLIFYPSVSGSLLVNRMLQLPRMFSYVQLRANYAEVGNDTDPYQTQGVYNAKVPYMGQPTLSGQPVIANTNLVPEITKSVEFGTDIRLFNDRIGLDVTYYNGNTFTQIIALPVPISSGYTQQVVNGSTVNTKGWEAILNITPIKNSNFSWNTRFNFSRYRSFVLDLPDGVSKLTLGYNRVYDNLNQTVWMQVEEGGRIGDLYGTGWKKNADGQYIVNSSGNFIDDGTLKKLGNYNPDFMLGWYNQVSYKNFSLGFLADWKQGGIVVSRTLALAGVGGQLIETENRPAEGIVIDGVVNTGTDANPVYEKNTKLITAESYYRQYYDRNHEENNTYDGSFVKLRQVSLSYRLTADDMKNTIFKNLQGISISLIGRNLFAISKIPHFDPEQMSLQGSQFVSGVEDMSYPTTKSCGIKLDVNF